MLKKRTHFFSLSFLLSFSSIILLQAQRHNSISLNDNWRFAATTLLTPPNSAVLGQNINQNGYKTELPNSALFALWQNGAIEAAISDENADRLTWLETKDWIFERPFDVDEKALEAEKIELILRGVDTYAGVFLNDFLVFKTDDVSKIWSADIKPLLKSKGNILRIYFVSTVNNNQMSQRHKNIESKATPLIVSCGLQSAELHVFNTPLKEEKTPQNVENIVWVHKIENDTFKLEVRNERSTKATGYFFIDVYDLKGNSIFNDMRMMSASAKSVVEFYRYDLQKFLQGEKPSNVVVVTTWKDGSNKPLEMKKTFYLAKPTTENASKGVALME